MKPAAWLGILLVGAMDGVALPATPQENTPPGVTVGVRWTGEPGITETVAQIMERQRLAGERPIGVLRRPLLDHRVPRQPESHPDAPAVSRWPPSEEPAVNALTPLTNPQAFGVSFNAIRLAESLAVPPDTMGDVGPTQILAAANGRLKVFNKAGALGPLNVDDEVFWSSVRGGFPVSDPHVRYDRLSGRWFLTIINVPLDAGGNAVGPNRILIAVSSGPTITSASSFTFFQFRQDAVGAPGADLNKFADYDTLGVDKFALYVGANMFDTTAGSYTGSTGFVINKAALLANSLVVTPFRQIATATTAGPFAPQGVDNDDPAATEGYFIGVDVLQFGLLQIRRVLGPGGAPSITGNLTVPVPSTFFPVNLVQVQPSPGLALDALDDRLYAAAIHKNKLTGATSLWTAHNIGVTAAGVGSAAGDRNGSRWYELGNLTTTPVLLQAGTLFNSAPTTPFGYWIPSVAMSGQGHMAIGASRASLSAALGGYPGIVAAGRLRTDPPGATQAPTLGRLGPTIYTVQPAPPQRWGDYSQTVVDPTDDMTMWTFQEYNDATNSWTVTALQLKAPPPATPVSVSPNRIPIGQPSVGILVTGAPVAGSEFFDPGPDTGGPGFSNHITAAVSGVPVNAIGFASPTQVALNVSTVGVTPGLKGVFIQNPDGQATFTANLLTVCPVTVDPSTVAGALGGVPYFQQFTVNGTGPFTWSLTGALPTGVTFNATAGTLSGTPTQLGTFNFTVSATDALGCAVSRPYTLTVSCPGIILSPAVLPGGAVGIPYSQALSAAPGVAPFAFSVLSGALPPGLSLSGNVISGTPTQAGIFPVVLLATDANGCAGGLYHIMLIACAQTMAVAPSTVPAGRVDTPYTQTFTQTGGTGVTFSLAGTLPTGLSFVSPTLSGTPTTAGVFPIAITARDAAGCTRNKSYSLVITSANGLAPVALAVDAAGNRVLDPGESVSLSPAWFNNAGTAVTAPGAASNFTGPGAPSNPTYTIADGAGNYGSIANDTSASCTATGDCYGLSLGTPTTRPIQHWDASCLETLTPTPGTGTDAKTWQLHVGGSFADVPASDPFYRFVETLFHGGVTGGCSATDYCGASSVTRAQMAVFLLRSKEGPAYLPPPAAGLFTDVPASSPFARWIEELARRGVTAGCGAGLYCPDLAVSRAQMAVLMLSTLEGSAYNPPPAIGQFNDVPASSGFARWIEELARRGITGGCSVAPPLYCPDTAVTRSQMAVFLSLAFGLNLYGP